MQLEHHNYGTSPFLMGKSSMEDSSDFTIMMDIWLVVEPYPSEKYEFVSWDDDIPNIWKNNPNVPNHQPDVLVHYPFWKFYLFVRFEPAHCFTK